MRKIIYYVFYVTVISIFAAIIIYSFKHSNTTHLLTYQVLENLKNKNLSSDVIQSQIDKIDGRIGILMQSDTITFLITIISIVMLSIGLFVLEKYNSKYIEIKTAIKDHNDQNDNEKINSLLLTKLLVITNLTLMIKSLNQATSIPRVREMLNDVNSTMNYKINKSLKDDFIDNIGYIRNNLSTYISKDKNLEELITAIENKINKLT